MAIDNAEKRKSISGIGFTPFAAPGVTPNTLKDAQWRSESSWNYSGMIPDPPSGGGSGDAIPAMTCGTLPTAGLGGSQITVGGGGGLN